MHSVLSNTFGDCNPISASKTEYEITNSLYNIQYDFDDFVSDSVCNSTASPSSLGYNYNIPSAVISVVLDGRTFADIIGINNGYFPVVDLPVVVMSESDTATTESIFYHNGHSYKVGSYVDPFYLGMKPMYCLINNVSHYHASLSASSATTLTPDQTGVTQVCFAPMGETENILALPVFLHYGASSGTYTATDNKPKPCFW